MNEVCTTSLCSPYYLREYAPWKKLVPHFHIYYKCANVILVSVLHAWSLVLILLKCCVAVMVRRSTVKCNLEVEKCQALQVMARTCRWEISILYIGFSLHPFQLSLILMTSGLSKSMSNISQALLIGPCNGTSIRPVCWQKTIGMCCLSESLQGSQTPSIGRYQHSLEAVSSETSSA